MNIGYYWGPERSGDVGALSSLFDQCLEGALSLEGRANASMVLCNFVAFGGQGDGAGAEACGIGGAVDQVLGGRRRGWGWGIRCGWRRRGSVLL